ncbi:hypothetical protein Agub_g823 [Astrephomene gubernaculifera]|uniref:Sugar phosphate transporter domain-containing protein n=1 Tax=Astrephomene gubernaculifera TaxID=47775 RepID=A0AAD3HH01_9CHLO|nr:hypothetical protein Agub_g823 [Astrephomene gubernaculifera]
MQLQHDGHDRELGLKEPLIPKSPGFQYGGRTFGARRGPFQGSSLLRIVAILFRSRLGLQLLTIAACLSWMTASSWAILVNKHIMVGLAFPYPCTIAWLGLATTTAASLAALQARTHLLPPLLRLLRRRQPRIAQSLLPPTLISLPSSSSLASLAVASSLSSTSSASSSTLPTATLLASSGTSISSTSSSSTGGGGSPLGSPSPSSASFLMTPRIYLTRVLPTGLVMALTFQLGNTGYLYLTVAFVQMLKAFCPVVTMLLLFFARLEVPSGRLVAAVALIAGGVALASYGEINMSLIGLTAMLASVVAEGVRLVLTQHLLAAGGSNLPPLEGLFYISSACTAVLTVQASYLEWPRLLRERLPASSSFGHPVPHGLHGAGGGAGGGGDYLIPLAHPGSFAAAACCGFLVNMLAILVIKLASSLTLKVLGTVKDAALVSIGILFLNEHVTRLQLVGYGISMVGFVSYNVIKSRQQQQQLGHYGGGHQVGVAAGGGGVGGGGGGVGVRSLLPLYRAGAGSGGGGSGGAGSSSDKAL